MHWVNRGPEPEGLEPIKNQYTPRWVKYYPIKDGAKPSDSRWRDFQSDLVEVFGGLCGYCETFAVGEVDHFRPKSGFPDLVYEWSNWVLACHDCNQAKGDKWPSGGYVDPCARSRPARPENFFDFDTLTGEILPKQGLSLGRSDKAQRMIDNLHLNDDHHLQRRRQWLWMVSERLDGSSGDQDSSLKNTLSTLIDRSTEFSSITRVLLYERGY